MVWQPRQPPAFDRYSPRFASPCAKPQVAAKRRKSPASAGLLQDIACLLLGAEAFVAGAAHLAHGSVLLLHAGLVLGARDLTELGGLALQALRQFVELGFLAISLRKRAGLLVLGAVVETVPRHLRQILEIGRIARDHVGVVRRDLAGRHACDRAPILAD